MKRAKFRKKNFTPGLLSAGILSVAAAGTLCFLLFYFPEAFPDSTIIRAARTTHLVLLGLSWLLAAVLLRRDGRAGQITGLLQSLLKNEAFLRGSTLLLILGFCISGWALLLPIYTVGHPLTPYVLRAAPLVLWLASSAGILLHVLRKLRKNESVPYWDPREAAPYIYSFAILGGLAVLVAWREFTRDPAELTNTIQGIPGVPILTSQLLVVVSITILCAGIFQLLRRLRTANMRLPVSLPADLVLAVLIGLAAFYFWGQAPLERSYFVVEERLPNFEKYPASDAALHDIHAQNLLIGEGLSRGDRQVVRRPLYSLLLAVSHLVAGQGYDETVRLQVALLSMFPAMLYLVVRHLSSREVGLLAAGLLILKESNAIALSGIIDVSHSKLMMSDMPTALAVCLFTLLLIRFLDSPERHRTLPLVLGGTLGMTMLVRSQVAVLALVPVGFLVVRTVRTQRRRVFFISTLGIFVGMLVTILPWMTRNYVRTGSIALESTSQLRLITERFSPEGVIEDTQRLPGDTEGEYGTRLLQQAVSLITTRPGAVLDLALKSYASNLYAAFLTLPTSGLSVDLESHVVDSGYWRKWDGQLQPRARMPIALNFLVVGLGVGALWKRNNLTGIVPLFVFLVFSFSSAAIGSSGWRFILPADWIVLVYFSAGIGGVFTFLFRETFSTQHGEREEQQDREPNPEPSQSVRRTWPVVFMLLAIGCLLPLSEGLVRPRFSAYSRAETLEQLAKNVSYSALPVESRETFEGMLRDEDTLVYWGRALYPIFIGAGEGVADTDWPSYAKRACDRIGFLLIGPNYNHAFMPLEDGGIEFPHSVDIVVVGNTYQNAFQVDALLLQPEDKVVLHFSSQLGNACSP